MFANTAGCRYTIPVTITPPRRRVVACNRAVSVIQPSMHGPERSPVKIGSKWSKVQPLSQNGTLSAVSHTSSTSCHVQTCGAVANANFMSPPSLVHACRRGRFAA